MALVIRLRKMGKNNYQTFRLVVLDKKRPRDGKYVEMLGWYNPRVEKNNISIKNDRVLYWLGIGAQLSDSARSLLKKAAPEVIKGFMASKLKPKASAKVETKTKEEPKVSSPKKASKEVIKEAPKAKAKKKA
jgi:small subunit ribosomal protein S16